ncbi:uncharacterized protein VTP21DRAFT_9431 [Calcarisporiella thermophila]|uniref:uncharacterized protein n=1 Tax=Calcarisporiella thermophila TaxID=911321 RepID=UPI0037445227
MRIRRRFRSAVTVTEFLAHRLLPAVDGNLTQARTELRWLREHFNKTTKDQSSWCRSTQLKSWIEDRVIRHKPLQYILGTQPFGRLDILVHPPVLIPRWETEEWTLRLVNMLSKCIDEKRKDNFRVLDLCTGTGCIALTLATNLRKEVCSVYGIDISEKALELARLNAQVSKVQNVEFAMVDLMQRDALPRLLSLTNNTPYDLIVSNPPYITQEEYNNLSNSVKYWEDSGALLAENGGMAFHERIAQVAPALLSSSTTCDIPRVVLEVGGSHQKMVSKYLKYNGFSRVETWKDLAGRERAIIAY